MESIFLHCTDNLLLILFRLARRLDTEFKQVFGNNFNLGGLSGFPFAGTTGFGAMAAHIPDDGSCLILHGPHVGITKDGQGTSFRRILSVACCI